MFYQRLLLFALKLAIFDFHSPCSDDWARSFRKQHTIRSLWDRPLTVRYNGRGASPHPAGRHLREGVFAMDSQTVIAVCALLALMVAIADLVRKE
jgi:hypothetical protein